MACSSFDGAFVLGVLAPTPASPQEGAPQGTPHTTQAAEPVRPSGHPSPSTVPRGKRSLMGASKFRATETMTGVKNTQKMS